MLGSSFLSCYCFSRGTSLWCSKCLWLHGLHHTRLLCPSLSSIVHSNSCPSTQWCYLTISSFASVFLFCLQSFLASGSFAMSGLVTSGGQNIGASVSVLPMNIQGWFPLWLTGVISWLSKKLSRVFSSTTILKHQFFGASFFYGPTLTLMC